MPLPLWKAAPRAFLHFNILKSFPKTVVQSLGLYLRQSLEKFSSKPLLLVFSISPDHLRLWYFLAKKRIRMEDWRLVIVDSAGTFDPKLFPDAEVYRFLNIYHGRKIDFFLRHLSSEEIFICDDDKYLERAIDSELRLLKNLDVAAVSLCSRNSFSFVIGGVHHKPMGSYALLFKKSAIIENNLFFQSPRYAVSTYKEFPVGVKHQFGYDTADYANEKLLLAGFEIPCADGAVTGFDGLSTSFVFLSSYSKRDVTEMLLGARHYSGGSVNGAVMRSIYCRTQFEEVFKAVFNENPIFMSGYSGTEVRAIIQANLFLDPLQKKDILGYCDAMDNVREKLIRQAI